MIQIILDASVAGKLSHLIEPVELCDLYGRVLGRFVPRIDMSEWEPVSPEVSEEELDRREQSQVDLPTIGGHPVKSVKSPWEVHHGEKAAFLHP